MGIINTATAEMLVNQNENEENEIKIKKIKSDMEAAEKLFYRTEINKKTERNRFL